MQRKLKKIAILLIINLILISCTSLKKVDSDLKNNENYSSVEISKEDYFIGNEDPLEKINRRIYYFNYIVDENFLIPLVNLYRKVTPDFLEKGVTNFYGNLKSVNTIANAALQTKGRKAMRAIGRFMINSVFGIGGFFDVASEFGMPKPYEDFGLTLAHYGIPRGPYVVLPFFGPSYLRDAFGMGTDFLISNNLDMYKKMELFEVNSPALTTLNVLDKRKNTNFRYYGTNSPFEYEYIRFLFSKYRMMQEMN